MTDEARLRAQAKALGDPTRHEIFRYIAEMDRPVDVAELTDHLGLNHNAIRQHLVKLVDAGLVTRRQDTADGPGRPRLLFAIDPTADARWGVAGPYQRLSVLLVEMLVSGFGAEEMGRRAGRRLEIDSAAPTDGIVELLHTAIARGGFEPEVVGEDEDHVEFGLMNCPFAEAVKADPKLVCELHLGLVRGLSEQISGVSSDRLVPRDPDTAGCRLAFRLTPPASTRVSR